MIVVIDPEIKKLFFDRLMEMCGNSPYETLKWIESVAFGENAILVKEQPDYTDKITELQKLLDGYRRDYIREKRVRQEMQRKMRNIDQEVESYMEELQGYRSVLVSSGLGRYVE